MPANELLPFGTGVGANVVSQAAYSALAGRTSGFAAGVAPSAHFNKVWRQSAFSSSMIGQFTADNSGFDTLDDGDVATYLSHFRLALRNSGVLYALDSGTADAMVIAFTPAFTAWTQLVGAQIVVKKNVAANTATTPTININGLGAKTLVKSDGSPISAGDLIGSSLFELVYDGTNVRVMSNTPQAIKKLAFKRTRVIFNTVGTTSYTIPAGVTTGKWTLWGGGGGSGAALLPSAAAGGGAGAYGDVVIDHQPGDTVSVTVGAGGTGAIQGGAAATNGGNTSITANSTTWTAGGGAASASVAASSVGNSAAGGTTTGTFNNAQVSDPSGGAIQGYSGSGVLYYGGRGGTARNGGSGGNAGTGAANAGQAPGGGAGGPGANAGANVSGSAGAAGEVWFEY